MEYGRPSNDIYLPGAAIVLPNLSNFTALQLQLKAFLEQLRCFGIRDGLQEVSWSELTKRRARAATLCHRDPDGLHATAIGGGCRTKLCYLRQACKCVVTGVSRTRAHKQLL